MLVEPEQQAQRLSPEVQAVCDSISALVDPEPGQLPDALADAELQALMRACSQLQARNACRAEQWRNSGWWAGDGSRSADARLSRDTGCSPGTAQRLLALGRSVVEMPVTRKTWSDGRLHTDKVALLTLANVPKRAAQFAADEPKLVGQCMKHRYKVASKHVRKWIDDTNLVVDPDGSPPEPETFAKASVTFGGTVVLDAVLDPVGGEMFMEQMHRIETDLYRDDLATDRKRTIAERRAAALVEMAVRAGTAPKDGKRPEPLICIVTGHESLATACESLAGNPLHPGSIVPYLTDAQLQSFIYDGAHDITRASRVRTFRGTLRRALQVRDRHCKHPSGCDIPATRCDGDHYPVGYAEGGETSMKNGRAMCDRHNRNAQLRNLAPPDPDPDPQPDLLDLTKPTEPSPPATGEIEFLDPDDPGADAPEPPSLASVRSQLLPPARAPDLTVDGHHVWLDAAHAA